MNDAERIAALEARLAEAEQTIAALLSGQIDAVATESGAAPVLLRAAQEKLRASEEMFRGVFEGALDGLILLGPDDRCVDVNPAGCAIFGRSRDEIVGVDLARFYAKSFDIAAARAALQRDGQLAGEITIVRPNGDERAVELMMRANVVGRMALGALRDVTERKSLQAQVVQAQRTEAIGTLAGGIAHDFNNLLTIILSYAGVLQENPSPAELQEWAREIHFAAKRGAELTSQLLVFSRRQVTQPAALDLGEVVAALGKMIRRLLPENIALEIVSAPRLGKVLVERGQIEQALINLAVNARDAMPEGGRLRIETRHATFDRRDHVVVSVSDTGTGIPEGIRDRIFEPFFTTKEVGRGTGLGLSIVFGIVTQSGGHVDCTSEVGKGTTFDLHFPTTSAVIAAAPSSAPPPTMSGHETVLVVEDDAQVRVLTKRLLSLAHYTVLDAGDADEAEGICTTHASGIDLLLTDVMLPGMNGQQLAERLCRACPNMRVLYMSGYPDDAFMHDRVAMLNFLPKPITKDSLLRRVREVLDAE